MKFILLLLLFAILVILFMASRKPKISRFARNITINATPEAIFEHINSMRKFNEWNPWAAADPSVINAFDGAEIGPGAAMRWAGKRTGEGRMEIRETTPPSHAIYDLEFIKPFKSTARVDYHLKPVGDQTQVTWSFEGEAKFINRVMQVFVNMEKMMNTSFDDGLARLKAIVEGE